MLVEIGEHTQEQALAGAGRAGDGQAGTRFQRCIERAGQGAVQPARPQPHHPARFASKRAWLRRP